MKLNIEQKDINLIIKATRKDFGIVLTEKQAKKLIESDTALIKTLIEGIYCIETLAVAVTNFVMGETTYSWPIYGDTKKYKKEFDAKLMECVKRKKIKLDMDYWESR